MTLETYNIPGRPYGGSDIFSFRDGAGVLWFVYSGRQKDNVFKQQVASFRDGTWKWYDVPVQYTARPTASIEPDGLYITYMTNDVNTVRRWKVPDFVMPGYPTNNVQAPVPPHPQVEYQDTTARQTAQANRTLIDKVQAVNEEQKKLIEAQQKEIANLKRQVAELIQNSGGLSWLQIKDHLWSDNIIQDKVYLDLQQKGGIYGMVEALVRELMKK